jgi:taurine dioxygenase
LALHAQPTEYTAPVPPIEVLPVTAEIGAEIRGVDLREPLSDEAFAAVEKALLDHLVIFFRNQAITPEQHLAFGRRFGGIQVAPFGPKHPEHPEITVLDQVEPRGQGADAWHTDNTYMPTPPMGSILRAVRLPRLGGDTCFASMYAAYEALSPPMRDLIGGLSAEHDLTRALARAIRDGNSDADLEAMQRAWPSETHPVVRTHPVTGRRALFVNGNFTTRLRGLSPLESDAMLTYLLDRVHSPAIQCRFRWEAGSIAFWDNRVVQHFAVPDYGERRIMHRVTLDGDRPA